MQIRPRREIEMSEFGMSGRIVLEPLNFSRKNQWRNNIGKATHYSAQGKNVKIESQDIGDMMVYKVLAYITDAPFMLNSFSAFSAYMDSLDSRELGLSDALMDRLNQEIEALKGDSPLPASATAETPSSE